MALKYLCNQITPCSRISEIVTDQIEHLYIVKLRSFFRYTSHESASTLMYQNSAYIFSVHKNYRLSWSRDHMICSTRHCLLNQFVLATFFYQFPCAWLENAVWF